MVCSTFCLEDFVSQSTQQLKVAGICGSLREGGFTAKALKIALAGAAEMGADTQFIDLRDYQLEFCDGSGNKNASMDLATLRDICATSHGLIWATPEYHGSFSGILKNALDLMSAEEFSGKVIGLVGVAGGDTGAINALNGLRTVGRSLGCWVVPHQASIASVYKAFDSDNCLLDPKLDKRVRQVGRQVVRHAALHHSPEIKEFMARWETPEPTKA